MPLSKTFTFLHPKANRCSSLHAVIFTLAQIFSYIFRVLFSQLKEKEKL